MSGWATTIVGLLGLLVGNLLNRSMEYRKWRRTERHKACTQLLDASHTAMGIAAFREAVPVAVREGLQDPFKRFSEVLESGSQGRVRRFLTKSAVKAIARRMNPEASAKDVDQTVSGLLASVTPQLEEPLADFLTERMGAGKSGRVTQLRETAYGLSVALESVELICPDEVVEAGRELFNAALALVGEETEGVAWSERLDQYSQARRLFVATARHDLVPDGRFRIRRRRPKPGSPVLERDTSTTDGSA